MNDTIFDKIDLTRLNTLVRLSLAKVELVLSKKNRDLLHSKLIDPLKQLYNGTQNIVVNNVWDEKKFSEFMISTYQKAKKLVDSFPTIEGSMEEMKAVQELKKAYSDLIEGVIKVHKKILEFDIMPIIKEYWITKGLKIYNISAIIFMITSFASAGLRYFSVFKVVELNNLAVNSKDYKEMLKYINALKAMQNKSWFTTAGGAKDLAKFSIENITKAYISIGVALILVSCITTIMFGFGTNIASEFKKLIQELDYKKLFNFLIKISGVGLLIIPGAIGICLITIALRGFKEEGIAESVVTKLSPVIELSNKVIKHVCELRIN